MKPSYTKATWIAKQMGVENVDDVLDCLLGNITRPADFVSDVFEYSTEYDEDYYGHQDRLD